MVMRGHLLQRERMALSAAGSTKRRPVYRVGEASSGSAAHVITPGSGTPATVREIERRCPVTRAVFRAEYSEQGGIIDAGDCLTIAEEPTIGGRIAPEV